jgi:iron complex outermembrane recepter protein
VIGGEYDRSSVSSDLVNDPNFPPNTTTSFHRDEYAVFGEGQIPLIASQVNPTRTTLSLSLAGRFDHYSDFGRTTNPQYGIVWRPSDTLLFRGAYATSFKAPSLADLYAAQFTFPDTVVVDPATGKTVVVPSTSGGNPLLRPQEGDSRSLGIVYASQAVPDFRLSVTLWSVRLRDAIQSPQVQLIVDNESSFPGRVLRDPSGQITEVIATNLNFGSIDVGGLDYQFNYRYKTPFGDFSPYLNATQTYRYQAALVPGGTPVDGLNIAQDSTAWSPRWKGTIGTRWNLGSYSANFDGRYVSRYQDYDSTREIGNFWICDANFRFLVGQQIAPNRHVLNGMYVEIGAVNIFNRLPQFSNYGLGLLGYDAAQADIRGRFLFGKVGMSF